MRWKRIFSMASENMKQRRLRTSLTTLGVIIGISAIIALASLGEGFRTTVKNRMEQGFELDVLTVIPGTLFAGYRPQRFTEIEIKSVSQVANVSIATSVMQIGNVTLYKGNEKVSAFVAAAVNFSEFQEVFSDRFRFEEGGVPEHVGNDTLVLGRKVNYPNEAEPAFARFNDTVTVTLGNIPISYPPYVKLENYSFTIAGILQKTGTPGLTNFDYWAFIPLDSARKIYGTNSSDLIFVKVPNPEFSESVAEDIEDLFPPYQITVLVPLSFIQQVDFILNVIEIFLTSVASIALLVAGIGIMNIMTVSVMERTREIGILKAIGAKNRTVLTMFLAETILIGLAGSLTGVLTGYGLAHILSYVLSGFFTPRHGSAFQTPETPGMSITPIFSFQWTVGALAFGTLICILFGLYPARKAAKLDPVEALRYE